MITNDPEIPLTFLIRESIAGNQKMQNKLYNQIAKKLYPLCFNYTKNTADAEDILQQGFIKIFSNLDKFRGEGSFEGWIRKIITRTAITHITKNKKFSFQTEFEHNFEDNSGNILDTLTEKDIIKLISKLPPGYRRIFIMHAIEGYNHREIAGILGCSEGNCKSQFYRSRTRLKQILKMRT